MPRLFWGLVILVVVALGVEGGYWWGLQQGKTANPPSAQKRTTQAQPSPQALLPGFQKTQALMNTSGQLLTKTKVMQVFYGEIKDMEQGKSWTLQKKGKMVTLRHEGTEGIEYFVRFGSPEEESQSINPERIKVGDKVSITTFIDPLFGQMSVRRITLILPSPTSALTPTPFPTQ